MSSSHPVTCRRTFALLALGILPWWITPNAAIAREGRQEGTTAAREGHRAVAEAELALTRARRDAAALGVKIAEASAAAATAEREYREKQQGRIVELVKRGSVDRLLVEEEEERYRGAQAAERAAGLETDVARARLAVAEAAIREAQAVSDIARMGSGFAPAVQAENDLEDARAERAHARHRVEQAEAEAAHASAFREHRKKEFDRFGALAGKGAIEPRLIDEQEDRYRSAQADERQARAKIDQARASVAVADASVRAAEARRDLARAVARLTGDPRAGRDPAILKEALGRFHRARGDRARSEREAARLEVLRLETKAEQESAAVAYRSRQLDRVKQLAARRAVESRLVDEHELALSEARHIQRVAEAAVKSARARLEAAEARLRSVEAESVEFDQRPDAAPSVRRGDQGRSGKGLPVAFDARSDGRPGSTHRIAAMRERTERPRR